MDKKSSRIAYGETLVKLGEENNKIVVLDADLSKSTMTKFFHDKFPDRFFNMGIAEANLMCVAAGMSHSGYIPFVSTFAMFGTGRAYEQVRNSIAYTKANVKLALTHSGISVGEDGGSHQSIEDISLMRVLPGMTILVPCDAYETEKAVRAAVEIDGPVYIRIARPVTQCITSPDDEFEVGKARILKDGSDVCIFTMGLMVERSIEAANILESKGVSVAVVNMHTIKPIDQECIINMSKKCKCFISAEEHSIIGGLGSAISEVIAENGLGVKFARIGIQDKFGTSGEPESLFEEYGLTSQNIVEKYESMI